jgi:hypothetical protein
MGVVSADAKVHGTADKLKATTATTMFENFISFFPVNELQSPKPIGLRICHCHSEATTINDIVRQARRLWDFAQTRTFGKVRASTPLDPRLTSTADGSERQ